MQGWRARWTLRALGLAAVLGSPSAWADSYDEEDVPLPEPEDPDAQPETAPLVEDEPLSAGGLSAPAALGDPGDQSTAVDKDLREADEKDSGRGLEFAWLSGEFGLTSLDVAALDGASFVAAGDSSGGTGLSFGGGLGVRLLYFTLGAHVRAGSPGSLSFLGVSGGASFKLPIGQFEPFVALDLGYLGVSGLAAASATGGGLGGVGGFDSRLGLGADYYFSNYFSLGALVGGDLLFLNRPAYQTADFGSGPVDPVYLQSASSVGAAFSASLTVGFHL